MESSELSSDSEQDVPLSESGPVPVLGKRDRVPTPPPVKVEKKGKAKEKKVLAPRRMVLFVFFWRYEGLTFILFFFFRFEQRNAGNRLLPPCFSPSSPAKGLPVVATKKTEVRSTFHRVLPLSSVVIFA